MKVLSLLSVLASAITVVNGLGVTRPPTGAVVVDINSNSDTTYKSIQEAVWSLPNDTSSQTIFIYPGTYRGQVILLGRPGPTTFQGYTKDIHDQKSNTVLLTNSLVASVAGSNSKSATLQIYSNDTNVYNLDIENTYGTGGGRGAQAQALALSQAGQRNGYYGVGFFSYQDTVYTVNGTSYFSNTYIQGAVDYIFGMKGVAYFCNSILASSSRGFITAQGRESTAYFGAYVFDNIKLITVMNATDNSMYLGRPWRNHSTVVYKNSDFGNVVNLRGWTNWTPTDPRTDTVYYGEYNNRGASAWNPARANFSKLISKEEAEGQWSIKGTLGSDNWIDKRFC
ncbi:carbohydrate esterase family 8 protein [Choiromyces venosus 120613-1]|uniref:Pectinesterase n=1 Tax=Choiromyces venosus 120613-1 TaxID=1336337 RepID=A0A3N4K6S6_9PEZI|nr:carbohydrate esterase family 8 protein [Choiromyces venosus 120613-1]